MQHCPNAPASHGGSLSSDHGIGNPTDFGINDHSLKTPITNSQTEKCEFVDWVQIHDVVWELRSAQAGIDKILVVVKQIDELTGSTTKRTKNKRQTRYYDTYLKLLNYQNVEELTITLEKVKEDKRRIENYKTKTKCDNEDAHHDDLAKLSGQITRFHFQFEQILMELKELSEEYARNAGKSIELPKMPDRRGSRFLLKEKRARYIQVQKQKIADQKAKDLNKELKKPRRAAAKDSTKESEKEIPQAVTPDMGDLEAKTQEAAPIVVEEDDSDIGSEFGSSDDSFSNEATNGRRRLQACDTELRKFLITVQKNHSEA